ncbi:MAG TPA: hypothetical protein VE091_02325 [Gemmatimonadales bacterium]|nr:hypothetical protein [Gemmatimonadales bacterium]
MLREVRGTYRGTPYIVRLVTPPPPSDVLYEWYNAEWEIDCEAVEILTFPAYAGDTEGYVRAETELVLAMMLESREHTSRESA